MSTSFYGGDPATADPVVTPGDYGDGENIPVVTVDNQGRVVGIEETPVSEKSVTLTGDVSGSGLTNGSIAVTLATVPVAKGGTGQTTPAGAFDALAPTTTEGDLIYRGASGNARLAKGAAGKVLKMNSGATAPEWGDGVAGGNGVAAIVALTQAEYDLLTPVATTLYVITD